MAIKCKKIPPGYYQGIYKNIAFKILKVEQFNSHTQNCWYWEIGNIGGDDCFPKKAIALEAVMEYIDDISKE